MPTFLHVWRSLRRSPAFTTTAVLTLAIGLGATTAIFTVLRAVVLNPLPYPDADRLYVARLAMPGMHYEMGQSLPTYFTYKQFARSIEGIAVYDPTAVDVTDVASEGSAEHLRAALITASAFPLLGAGFELGRGFSESEDAPRGALVVVLANGLWRRRYGGDRAIIGKKILVNSQEREVVGVAAAGFEFPDATTELWLPVALDPHAAYGGDFRHRAIVKLRRGVTPAAVEREMNDLLPRAAEQFPELFAGVSTAELLKQGRAQAVVRPMRDDVVGSMGGVLWIAAAAGVLILFTACANVGSLLLARADNRQREFAVRRALGAGWQQMLGQHLMESFLLAGIGGGLGAMLAGAGLILLTRVGPTQVPRLTEVRADGGILFLAVLITCGVALFACAVPMLRSRAGALAQSLRDRARGGTASHQDQRARRTLVVVQVAFAVVLVGGAVLLLRSFDRLRHVRPGFDADHALVLWLSLPKATYPGDDDVVRFTDRLLSRLADVPGVRAVGVTSKVPLNRTGRAYSPVWSDNDQTEANSLPPSVQFTTVTGEYFGAMGIPLIAGRTFLPLNRQQTGEAVIDRTMALQFWHDSTGQRALGRRLRYTPGHTPWYTVVGVVGNVHDTSLAAPVTGQLYFPDLHAADPTFDQVARTMGVVVRFDGYRAPTEAVRRDIQELDRTLAVFDVSVMADIVGESMARLTFVMIILAVSASVALALAAIGLYGVIAYIVTLRTAEIGLRIALGAPPDRVARLVTYQGATVAALGVGAGVAIFAFVSRFLRSLVFGVSVVDPVTILAVSLVLMTVALGASWIPARRAARIDPVRALAGDA